MGVFSWEGWFLAVLRGVVGLGDLLLAVWGYFFRLV